MLLTLRARMETVSTVFSPSDHFRPLCFSAPPLPPLFLNCWRKNMHDALMFILKGLFTLIAVRCMRSRVLCPCGTCLDEMVSHSYALSLSIMEVEEYVLGREWDVILLSFPMGSFCHVDSEVGT